MCLKKVHWWVIQTAPESWELSYRKRMIATHMTKQEDRKTRGNMIIIFRFRNGSDSVMIKLFFVIEMKKSTTGHNKKLISK